MTRAMILTGLLWIQPTLIEDVTKSSHQKYLKALKIHFFVWIIEMFYQEPKNKQSSRKFLTFSSKK